MRTHTQQSATDMILGNPAILAMIGAAAVGSVVVAVMIRKRRSRRKLKMLTGGDTDIVSVLENHDKKQNESK